MKKRATKAPPFKQITVAAGDSDSVDIIYGLDSDGRVWQLVNDGSDAVWRRLPTEAGDPR